MQGSFCGFLPRLAPPTQAFVLDKSRDSFTPRVSVRYALADRLNVYVTFSQGFKSGAYNSSSYPSSTAAIAAVDPEPLPSPGCRMLPPRRSPESTAISPSPWPRGCV
ncbi:TonB-dependent receptor domain-containing protein [Novosphingobium pokkalii]|uniref:TonB-dependent receptor domain-containing protein n=1 Tax=Novosphingobium pokkalii TaxID=1770194 RepID=A0ABV7V9X9_9SPHN